MSPPLSKTFPTSEEPTDKSIWFPAHSRAVKNVHFVYSKDSLCQSDGGWQNDYYYYTQICIQLQNQIKNLSKEKNQEI